MEGFGKEAGPWQGSTRLEHIRNNAAYQILTPEQTLAMADGLGNNGVIFLNPLFSGIEPADAFTMLELFENKVMPYLPARS